MERTEMPNDECKVMLSRPIEVPGVGEVGEIVLSAPRVSQLKGIKMLDILQGDGEAAAKLIPRISKPSLGPDELEKLHPADFTAIFQAILGFFVPAATE
jgi:hypothetical protein